MATLIMSRQERERMTIMAGVEPALTQVQAAELMGLGYRQTKRVWQASPLDAHRGVPRNLTKS